MIQPTSYFKKTGYLLAIAIFLCTGGSAAAFDPCNKDEVYTPIAERYKTGLVFSVEKCGIPTSHVVGTMHTDDPEVIEMMDHAFGILAESRLANFEIDSDPAHEMEAMRAMYYPPESVKTLRDVVGQELYSKLQLAMQKLQPEIEETAYFRMRPWAVAILMQYPKNVDDGIVLDQKLENYAIERGIKVRGLETAKEQLEIFSNIPEEKQIYFLKEAVDNVELHVKQVKLLSDLYIAADLKGIEKMSREAFDQYADKEFAKDIENKLITLRNKTMVQRMGYSLKKGNVFTAVGALHLPGEDGILKLLEDKGYYIDIVKTPDEVFEDEMR